MKNRLGANEKPFRRKIFAFIVTSVLHYLLNYGNLRFLC